MVENVDQGSQLESNTMGIFRSAATVKGGRRFSFGALVVVGDREGRVGIGYAKANEVPPAIEKAQKDGRKAVRKVNLHGGTIPHEVVGRYSASVVKLMPASPGTGVVAGATVRAVLEMAGITDCMSKSYGSNNKKNLAKATLNALETLRTKQDVSRVRGIEIARTEVDEMIERGAAFMAPAGGAKKDAAADEAKADNGAATAVAEKPAQGEKKAGEKKADGEKKQNKDNA